jgi:hypothetical protein
MTKNETTEKLIPLLKEFTEAAAVDKEARKEIREIRDFLEELSDHPEEIESKEVEEVTRKFKDKGFLQKVNGLLSVPVNLLTIAEKIVPLLTVLKDCLPGS